MKDSIHIFQFTPPENDDSDEVEVYECNVCDREFTTGRKINFGTSCEYVCLDCFNEQDFQDCITNSLQIKSITKLNN